jgi:predicted O-methyltransferase YrrM
MYTTLLSWRKHWEKEGEIIALDMTDEYCESGKKYWKEAGVDIVRLTFAHCTSYGVVGRDD